MAMQLMDTAQTAVGSLLSTSNSVVSSMISTQGLLSSVSSLSSGSYVSVSAAQGSLNDISGLSSSIIKINDSLSSNVTNIGSLNSSLQSAMGDAHTLMSNVSALPVSVSNSFKTASTITRDISTASSSIVSQMVSLINSVLGIQTLANNPLSTLPDIQSAMSSISSLASIASSQVTTISASASSIASLSRSVSGIVSDIASISNKFATGPAGRSAPSVLSGSSTGGSLINTSGLISAARSTISSMANTDTVYKETVGIGKGSFVDYLNHILMVDQEQPDISGYTFVFIEPPDLSGMPANSETQAKIDEICKKSLFLAIDATPPQISINVEQINTQASVSMPYATTKVATGNLSITFIDNAVMDINSLHNVWIEYIYNQLWGDLKPHSDYIDPKNDKFGQLDYATSAFIVKYDPTFSDPPVMVGKATGIFPTALPVKEPIGTRSNRELVMETVSYTCSYYEVVHPKSMLQFYSQDKTGSSILDELNKISDKFKSNFTSGAGSSTSSSENYNAGGIYETGPNNKTNG